MPSEVFMSYLEERAGNSIPSHPPTIISKPGLYGVVRIIKPGQIVKREPHTSITIATLIQLDTGSPRFANSAKGGGLTNGQKFLTLRFNALQRLVEY